MLSPGHLEARQLLLDLPPAARADRVHDLINLSLRYFYAGQYDLCIKTCKQILALDSRNPTAYNNMCSAYNKMGAWQQALSACQQALSIDPDFELARNNLKWAQKHMDGP